MTIALGTFAQKLYTDEAHGIKFSGPKGLESQLNQNNSWQASNQEFSMFVQVYTVDSQEGFNQLMLSLIQNTTQSGEFSIENLETAEQNTSLLEGTYVYNVVNQRLAMGMIFGFLTAKAATAYPINVLYYNITYKDKIKDLVFKTVIPSIKSTQE